VCCTRRGCVPPMHAPRCLLCVCCVQEADPDKLTPGPGAYARPRSAPSRAATAAVCASAWSPRTKQPLFARCAGRAAPLSVGVGWSLPPERRAGPGPAAYNVGGAAATAGSSASAMLRLLCTSRRSGRAHNIAPPPAGVGGGQAAAGAAEGGFGTSSQRFGDCSTASPGPGVAASCGCRTQHRHAHNTAGA
jgi:hypothetical protein